MGDFGKTLFGGSRFIFWSLAPFLLLFAVSMPLMIDEWTIERAIVVTVLSLTAVLLTLALYSPKTFWWAGRGVTGIVFVGYLAYLVDELFLSGEPFRLAGSRAESSPRNALLGFIFIGLPCLYHAVLGRFSLRADRNAPEPSGRQPRAE